MSASLTVHGKGKAELAEQISFTPDQMQLMKDTVAKGVSDNEFMLFMHLAQHYGLDPFAKEVWCIKYGNNPATIFTSRDGYLKIASRDPQMNGIQSDAVCENDTFRRLADGTPEHIYGLPDRGALVGAWAMVHRKDRDFSAYFYAPFKEYNNGSNPTWKKYPTAMIIKVAEAMALKRAFSISGLVTQEEIGLDMQAEPDAGTGATEVVEQPAAEPARVHVAGTVSTQAEIDEREIKGHRTRFEQASTIKQVAQIWAKIPTRLAEALLADKEAAKKRFEKTAPKEPVHDTQLMAEFVKQPELGMGQPATDAQRQEIQRLCNLQVIGKGEKSDMLLVLYKLDEARAGQMIFKLGNEIALREGRDADKEWRQALHKFIYKYSTQLGEYEVARLSAMEDDMGVHWQTIRTEMRALIDSLKQAQAIAA